MDLVRMDPVFHLLIEAIPTLIRSASCSWVMFFLFTSQFSTHREDVFL